MREELEKEVLVVKEEEEKEEVEKIEAVEMEKGREEEEEEEEEEEGGSSSIPHCYSPRIHLECTVRSCRIYHL